MEYSPPNGLQRKVLDHPSPELSVHNYPPNHLAEDAGTILDYFRVFWKRKAQILLITFICLGLAIFASFYLSPKYKAQATLMPINSSGSGGLGNLASQISSIPIVGGQLGGLGSLAGGKSKELVAILKSRTLAGIIVKKFDLMKVIFAKQYDPATNRVKPNWMGGVPVEEDAVNVFMKKIATVEEEKKSGLIKIEVRLKDPELAAKIGNQMIVELQNFIEKNNVTISKRNRIFIEEQLVKNAAKLLESGKELNNFYAQNKISSVVPQLNVDVGSYAPVPKPFEEFQGDIGGLNGVGGEGKTKETEKVLGVPGQVYLQYLNLNRELISKTHALLTQQYEIAKIDEAKEDLAFQVIDRAEVKVRSYFPNLMINIIVGLFGGLCLGLFFAFFKEYISRLKEKEASR